MKLLLPVLIALSLLQPNALRADEASQKKAAESLLGLMGMEKLLSQSIDQMLALQVQQNPSLAPYQAQMKTFLNKYMSWASLKDDMAKVYMAEFTEAELNDLIKFYQTPLGKKTVEKMPSLDVEGRGDGAEADAGASAGIAGRDSSRRRHGKENAVTRRGIYRASMSARTRFFFAP